MSNIINVINDKSESLKNLVNEYSQLKLGGGTDKLICAFAYKAVSNLPYSIDPMQKEYSPLEFINIGPITPTIRLFKEYQSIYDGMASWSDTRKNAVILQLLHILSEMLCGRISIQNIDKYTETIFNISNDDTYNECFSAVFKRLPEYYLEIINSKTNEERRNALDTILDEMRSEIGQRFSKKGSGTWSPFMDFKMYLDGVYNIDLGELYEIHTSNMALLSAYTQLPTETINLETKLIESKNFN